MNERKTQKKGGTRKHGRCYRKASKKNYVARNQRRRNKVKRIAQSNGVKALASWKKYDGSHRKLNHKGVYFPRVKRNEPVDFAEKNRVLFVDESLDRFTFVSGEDAQTFVDEVMNGYVPDKDAS